MAKGILAFRNITLIGKMVRKFRRGHDSRIPGVRLLLVLPCLRRWVPGRCAVEGVEEVLEHLEILKGVLEKPLPRREEIERFVPPDARLKSLFMDMLDEIGEIPEDETSKKVLIRMASGPKYGAYRERADRIIEHLNFVMKHLERMTAGSESVKVRLVRG